MKETIQISLPEEIMEKAEERGVDIDNFKDTVETFAILDITARASRLTKKQGEVLSKKTKASAWKKIKKSVNL